MNKKLLLLVLIFTVAFVSLFAQTTDNPALFPILNNFSTRTFSPEPVTRAEIDTIVRAGLRSPSAGNRQPWLITVVQNMNLAKQLFPDITEGNALIVISGPGDGKTNSTVILDCALAAQSMYLAAQAMKLGARQYTNSALINRINSSKTTLGIPEDHNAIIAIRVGKLPSGIDVISSASPRHDPAQKVVYR